MKVDDSTLLAESTVMNLLGSYGRLIDDGKWEDWRALFGPDGVLALGDQEISGDTALTAFVQDSPPGVHTQSVPSISIRPDGIAEVASSFIFVAATGSIVAGAYDDLVASDGAGGAVFIRRGIRITIRH